MGSDRVSSSDNLVRRVDWLNLGINLTAVVVAVVIPLVIGLVSLSNRLASLEESIRRIDEREMTRAGDYIEFQREVRTHFKESDSEFDRVREWVDNRLDVRVADRFTGTQADDLRDMIMSELNGLTDRTSRSEAMLSLLAERLEAVAGKYDDQRVLIELLINQLGLEREMSESGHD